MDTHIGIDISKFKFDVHETGNQTYRSFDYNDHQVEACAQWLLSINPALVVMEATGGYEIELAIALLEKGLPVTVVNPRWIRDFARAIGQLAKTDKIDARIIAQYAATIKPEPQTEIDRTSLTIKALVARRRQLVAMRVQESNRTEHAMDAIVKDSIDVVIKAFNSEIENIEQALADLIATDSALKQKANLFETMPGIGKTTASMLIVQLPELGILDRRQIASLVGLAPVNRDSGCFRGKRMTGGGRTDVRTQLYMPTLVAIQHNPVIRKFYNHLLDSGKSKMVAVVACMRKIITILNAMAAKNQPWNPNFA